MALGVEYDGGAFHGFQRQRSVVTVQQELEEALSRVADRTVTVAAAGRTDAGVHATGQVVGFHTAAERPVDAWRDGVNSLTSKAVSVRWARSVDADFHPRYSATARRYMYLWYEDTVRSPTLDARASRVKRLDEGAMHRAGQALVGEHDFSSFRAAGCQSASAYRCVHRLAVHRSGSVVTLDITANAFLLHMVRNIAAALLLVGDGSRSERSLCELLVARDRALNGPTAPARGLYLVDVRYPQYHFPHSVLPAPLRALGSLERF